MLPDIQKYHHHLEKNDQDICNKLYTIIKTHCPNAEPKIWHGAPVWFIDQNPIMGYHKMKAGVQLLFWSGQSFEETDLQPVGKFKASQKIYNEMEEINESKIIEWIQKAQTIQWDYKNIVKNNGVLNKIEKSI